MVQLSLTLSLSSILIPKLPSKQLLLSAKAYSAEIYLCSTDWFSVFDSNLHVQAEGIFRINGENGQEEYIREELNRGVVPENIDVHCLAGLIKVVICK